MALNFPPIHLKFKDTQEGKMVFDPIRKMYVQFTPEEEVRQYIIRMLVDYLHIPAGLIAIEKQIKYGNLVKRPDILVYSADAAPLLIVECKAPSIGLGQNVLSQIASYQKSVVAPFLLISNGLKHYSFRYMPNTTKFELNESIPDFNEMSIWAKL